MALNREECRNESDILAVHNLKGIACVNPKTRNSRTIHTVYIRT